MPSPPDDPDLLRVSCAALCRIMHQGRYLLVLNQQRRRRGRYVLAPVGGALALTEPEHLTAFGARLEDPAAADLRLYLPAGALAGFRAWFHSGQGRERSPFRELYEELVSETRLLPALSPGDVIAEPLRTVERREPTDRHGDAGPLTHYFLELYDVRFTSARILAALRDPAPDSGAVWLTPAQIAAGALRLVVDGVLCDVTVRASLLLG
ncbi:MAG: hypothetical protein AB1435_04045 [Chloroflexota bacterium]